MRRVMPTEARSSSSRASFAALGVAGVVVATVFAGVAALATTEQASPVPFQPLPDDTVSRTAPAPSGPGSAPGPGAGLPEAATPSTVTATSTVPPAPVTSTATSEASPPQSPAPPAQPQPPEARYNFSCDGRTCSFDATGSTDADGRITYFAWTFGDGDSSQGERSSRLSHRYDRSGSYTVTLAVVDNSRQTDTISRRITVRSS